MQDPKYNYTPCEILTLQDMPILIKTSVNNKRPIMNGDHIQPSSQRRRMHTSEEQQNTNSFGLGGKKRKTLHFKKI